MDNQQPQGDAGVRTAKDGLLEIRTSEYRGAWLVDVRGELDLANIGTLENELWLLDGGKGITVDLTQLDFMDNSGLALLARIAAQTRAERLTVRPGSGQVYRVLRVCGLDTHLPIAD